MIDLDEVRRKYNYDPETGLFTWKVSTPSFRGKARAGQPAGSLNDQGYIIIYVGRRHIRAHRAAWELYNGPIPEGYEIDHDNGVRDDNRLSNLIAKTPSLNQHNRYLEHDNVSGYPGVTMVVRKSGLVRWDARICISRETILLGVHTTKHAAIEARQKAERDYLGINRVVEDMRRKSVDIEHDTHTHTFFGNQTAAQITHTSAQAEARNASR